MAKFTPYNRDIELLKKLNKSLSNKKSKLKVNHGIEIDIQRAMITDFSSRKEFNAFKKKVQQFADPKNHRYVKNVHNVSIPREEWKKVRDLVKKGNKIKEKRLNKIKEKEFMDRGKPEGYKVGDSLYRMGDRRFVDLKPTNFNMDTYRTVKEFRDAKKKIEKRFDKDFLHKKDLHMRSNYLIGVENVYGEAGKKLRKKILSMPLDKFIDIAMTENLGSISYHYTFEEMLLKLKQIEGVFGV